MDQRQLETRSMALDWLKFFWRSNVQQKERMYSVIRPFNFYVAQDHDGFKMLLLLDEAGQRYCRDITFAGSGSLSPATPLLWTPSPPEQIELTTKVLETTELEQATGKEKIGSPPLPDPGLDTIKEF